MVREITSVLCLRFVGFVWARKRIWGTVKSTVIAGWSLKGKRVFMEGSGSNVMYHLIINNFGGM